LVTKNKLSGSNIALFIIVCFSCKNGTKKQSKNIPLKDYIIIKLNSDKKKQILLSNIAESIKVIEFQSSDSTVIGKVDK